MSKELEACQEAIKIGDMYEVLSLTSKGFDVSLEPKSEHDPNHSFTTPLCLIVTKLLVLWGRSTLPARTASAPSISAHAMARCVRWHTSFDAKAHECRKHAGRSEKQEMVDRQGTLFASSFTPSYPTLTKGFVIHDFMVSNRIGLHACASENGRLSVVRGAARRY